MNFSNTFPAVSRLACTVLCCFFLAGCYEYTQPPISEANLRPIGETTLGAKFLNLAKLMANDENMRKASKGMTEDTRVLELSPDMLLYQQKSERGPNWEISILMATSDHLGFCTYLASDEAKVVEGLKLLKKKDGPSTVYVVSGDQAKMQAHVEELARESPKLCLLIPIAALQ